MYYLSHVQLVVRKVARLVCASSPDKDGHNKSLENMKNLINIINSKELENNWSTAKKLSISTIQDDSNNIHHEHIGDASKSDW